MPYNPQAWADNADGGTPITAARLNYMEAGIAGAQSDGVIVIHGSDPDRVRPPVGSTPVIWIGSVDPVNSDDTIDVTLYVTEA